MNVLFLAIVQLYLSQNLSAWIKICAKIATCQMYPIIRINYFLHADISCILCLGNSEIILLAEINLLLSDWLIVNDLNC